MELDSTDNPGRFFFALVKDLKSLALNNIQYFESGKQSHHAKFHLTFCLLYEYLDVGIEPSFRELAHHVSEYDFSPDVKGNGYRSLLRVVQKCCAHLLQLCRYISTSRDSVLFRKKVYAKELESYVSALGQLRAVLYYGLKLTQYCQPGQLFADEDHLNSDIAESLMLEVESLSQESFYGRCLGFQYCESMQRPLQAIGIVMASYSEGYLETSQMMKVATSVFNSGKYILDPELRAKQMVKVTRTADIRFCQALWNITESPIMHQLPSFVCPVMEVNELVTLGPDAFELPLVDGSDTVVITPPCAHTGPAHVHTRLISAHLREGQHSLRKSTKAKTPMSAKPRVPGLVVHIHGGGFVAQSSKSHEVYLRDWAISLGCPILSVDYSLAPQHPFPRALEECFYAYAWAVKNSHMLGSTGEKIVIVGDSAGGNLAISTAMRAASYGIRAPDGLVTVYPVTVVKYTPSPARLLCLMDPVLPVGLMARCLAAYAGIDENDSQASPTMGEVHSDKSLTRIRMESYEAPDNDWIIIAQDEDDLDRIRSSSGVDLESPSSGVHQTQPSGSPDRAGRSVVDSLEDSMGEEEDRETVFGVSTDIENKRVSFSPSGETKIEKRNSQLNTSCDLVKDDDNVIFSQLVADGSCIFPSEEVITSTAAASTKNVVTEGEDGDVSVTNTDTEIVGKDILVNPLTDQSVGGLRSDNQASRVSISQETLQDQNNPLCSSTNVESPGAKVRPSPVIPSGLEDNKNPQCTSPTNVEEPSPLVSPSGSSASGFKSKFQSKARKMMAGAQSVFTSLSSLMPAASGNMSASALDVLNSFSSVATTPPGSSAVSASTSSPTSAQNLVEVEASSSPTTCKSLTVVSPLSDDYNSASPSATVEPKLSTPVFPSSTPTSHAGPGVSSVPEVSMNVVATPGPSLVPNQTNVIQENEFKYHKNNYDSSDSRYSTVMLSSPTSNKTADVFEQSSKEETSLHPQSFTTKPTTSETKQETTASETLDHNPADDSSTCIEDNFPHNVSQNHPATTQQHPTSGLSPQLPPPHDTGAQTHATMPNSPLTSDLATYPTTIPTPTLTSDPASHPITMPTPTLNSDPATTAPHQQSPMSSSSSGVFLTPISTPLSPFDQAIADANPGRPDSVSSGSAVFLSEDAAFPTPEGGLTDTSHQSFTPSPDEHFTTKQGIRSSPEGHHTPKQGISSSPEGHHTPKQGISSSPEGHHDLKQAVGPESTQETLESCPANETHQLAKASLDSYQHTCCTDSETNGTIEEYQNQQKLPSTNSNQDQNHHIVPLSDSGNATNKIDQSNPTNVCNTPKQEILNNELLDLSDSCSTTPPNLRPDLTLNNTRMSPPNNSDSMTTIPLDDDSLIVDNTPASVPCALTTDNNAQAAISNKSTTSCLQNLDLFSPTDESSPTHPVSIATSPSPILSIMHEADVHNPEEASPDSPASLPSESKELLEDALKPSNMEDEERIERDENSFDDANRTQETVDAEKMVNQDFDKHGGASKESQDTTGDSLKNQTDACKKSSGPNLEQLVKVSEDIDGVQADQDLVTNKNVDIAGCIENNLQSNTKESNAETESLKAYETDVEKSHQKAKHLDSTLSSAESKESGINVEANGLSSSKQEDLKKKETFTSEEIFVSCVSDEPDNVGRICENVSDKLDLLNAQEVMSELSSEKQIASQPSTRQNNQFTPIIPTSGSNLHPKLKRLCTPTTHARPLPHSEEEESSSTQDDETSIISTSTPSRMLSSRNEQEHDQTSTANQHNKSIINSAATSSIDNPSVNTHRKLKRLCNNHTVSPRDAPNFDRSFNNVDPSLDGVEPQPSGKRASPPTSLNLAGTTSNQHNTISPQPAAISVDNVKSSSVPATPSHSSLASTTTSTTADLQLTSDPMVTVTPTGSGSGKVRVWPMGCGVRPKSGGLQRSGSTPVLSSTVMAPSPATPQQSDGKTTPSYPPPSSSAVDGFTKGLKTGMSPSDFELQNFSSHSPLHLLRRTAVVKNPYMSPLTASDEMIRGLTRVSIVGCQLDPLLDDSVMFAKRLRDLGVTCDLHLVDDLPHGFLNFALLSLEARQAADLCGRKIADMLSDAV